MHDRRGQLVSSTERAAVSVVLQDVSWLVQPRLINDPFSDPGVFVDFRYGRRALLFDLGDLSPLSSRELMRVSHAFVSHTHLDHFAGFDRLLRVCLHRPGPLHLVGPEGFIDQVEHRLRSYTWNLLGERSADFRLVVSTFADDRLSRCAVFRARDRFARREAALEDTEPGRVLVEEQYRIEAVSLNHGSLPVLAFALVEHKRVNVWRGALDRMGLPVGSWLNEAKRAVRSGLPGDTRVQVTPETAMRLEDLGDVLRIGPGQKVAYVTDAAWTDENLAKIVGLAAGADQLFIEAAFLEAEAGLAAARSHLTAAQAGRIGRLAGVRHLVPFHFSPRYLGQPEALQEEALHAFYP